MSPHGPARSPHGQSAQYRAGDPPLLRKGGGITPHGGYCAVTAPAYSENRTLALPPPLIPWNDFDLDSGVPYAHACRMIAEILADDQWHQRASVIRAVGEAVPSLQTKTVANLIDRLSAHGDVRQHGRRIRLTTRWHR